MNGQRWRTYALLLHMYATYTAVSWVLDHLAAPWGSVAAIFLLGWALVGLIVPVTQDRVAKHRREEAA